MKTIQWLAAAACVIALPAFAAAQTTTTTTTTISTQTAVATPTSAPTAAAYPDEPYPIASHWLVSGSMGSDFEGSSFDHPGINYAATAGWLYHGVIGGEFQGNWSPNFQLNIPTLPVFVNGEPNVNSYMLNLMAAAPLMAGGQFQPYVSGGPGWFMMSATPTVGDEAIDLNHTDNGWNVGGGAMGFLGQLGVRGDVRYFKVSGSEFTAPDASVIRSSWGNVVDSAEPAINGNLISGMSFWRANLGVALRW